MRIDLARFRQLALSKSNWSDTLALPRSQFPARPTAADLETYRARCHDLYAWQRAHRPATITRTNASGGSSVVNNEFVLHDGPPYANGPVHMGHALNKILKDLMLRTELLRGKRVHYRPGWDCHGLPIELKALQQPASAASQANKSKDAPKREAQAASEAASRMTASAIRSAAAKLARQTIDVQEKNFRSWGVMGEWDAPYKTMSKDFEMRQLGVFREMVRKGLISRHCKPVHWSPSSRTALAEAELEYDEHHRTVAAFILMPIVRVPNVLCNDSSVDPERLSALIWTTTPWTLPANKAVAVRGDIDYCLLEVADHRGILDQMLVACDRMEHLRGVMPDATITTVKSFIKGADLADGSGACFNIFSGQESPILHADFVTAASGTGLVHVAPGHGMDDYLMCQKYGIRSAFAPIDDCGRFTADVWPTAKNEDQELLPGLLAPSEGVEAVLGVLRDCSSYLPAQIPSRCYDLVLAAHSFTHKSPIDWRTKQPVLTRATAQWFADASAIKERALTALEDVRFIPESGKSRLRSFVEGRSQWCISRQRAWGVPIPALYHVDTGAACITEHSINHIISVVERRGSDAWFSDPIDDPAWLHTSLEPGKWVRGTDTMDVWFDSGTSWTLLADRGLGIPLSDVYSEGSDQHRGWFQSSLLTAVAVQDSDATPIAPFKTLVTHGFTLDGEGKKMSKSLGNVVAPEDVLSGAFVQASRGKKQGKSQQQPSAQYGQKSSLGPDMLRLWVASSDCTRDVAISQTVLQSVQQALQKYRVTFKFLLGVLHDYPSPMPNNAFLHSDLGFSDQVVLARLGETSQAVFDAYGQYKFHAGTAEINKFINNDLSAFYFEIVKDKLYTGSTHVRRHTQTVLVYVLRELTKMLGAVTPHLIEEVQAWLPKQMQPELPLAAQTWDSAFQPHEVSRDFEAWRAQGESLLIMFKEISSAVKIGQERARAAKVLGNGLACQVEIYAPADVREGVDGFAALEMELPAMLVVSEVRWKDLEAAATAPQHDRCAWRFEQPLEIVVNGAKVAGMVAVLPPEREKCVRCWKYVAEESDVPCFDCRQVLVGAYPELVGAV
ncbi:hypothetical protein CERZMDRAFT_70305 [Cercospora zeae-maydis SCOH1-5]|uniref:isoleucine--tRNA ligase n=1 Tax=Cercospora zeae-maydis SCOH1-5 TaxID=717836 RepID=A0A6A6F6J5_9PEZI|nr:hypothetical protein CERZMDRAFT_70305 [Cercospora zeae-maydis SCOH1-5]